jgi:hypothetical protein
MAMVAKLGALSGQSPAAAELAGYQSQLAAQVRGRAGPRRGRAHAGAVGRCRPPLQPLQLKGPGGRALAPHASSCRCRPQVAQQRVAALQQEAQQVELLALQLHHAAQQQQQQAQRPPPAAPLPPASGAALADGAAWAPAPEQHPLSAAVGQMVKNGSFCRWALAGARGGAAPCAGCSCAACARGPC